MVPDLSVFLFACSACDVGPVETQLRQLLMSAAMTWSVTLHAEERQCQALTMIVGKTHKIVHHAPQAISQ